MNSSAVLARDEGLRRIVFFSRSSSAARFEIEREEMFKNSFVAQIGCLAVDGGNGGIELRVPVRRAARCRDWSGCVLFPPDREKMLRDKK